MVTGYYSNMPQIPVWNQLGTADSLQVPISGTFTRVIPLGGLGLQFTTTSSSNIYANITQCYDPLNYEDLYPGGGDEIIDPNLHDVHGYNSDIGFRGNIKNCLNFDIGGFYVFYQGAISTILLPDSNTEETNIGNAVHEGIESYLDWNIVRTFTKNSPIGYFDIFNALSYDNAKYSSGPYSGNWVAAAPQYISRTGITYTSPSPLNGGWGAFSVTVFWDYTSQQYTDANNTVYSYNAEVGIIPSYRIYDLSATYRIKNYTLKAGIDNFANANYYTVRVVEYPGPGIIPGVTRIGYIGFSATF
jgi:Fe(3+) dicitrate transport protein